MQDIYLFIGPPGSGKGSLAQECVQEFGWKQLSTGNLCRKHISEQTKIGKEIDFAIKSGKLIPDELVTTMVGQWLDQDARNAKAVILDGYPRTLTQAYALEALLTENIGQWSLKIINLIVNDDVIVRRLSHRFICQNNQCQAVYSLDPCLMMAENQDIGCELCKHPLCRRKDDEPEAIRERLVTHHRHEGNLLLFFRAKGYAILELGVERCLPEVFSHFKQLTDVGAVAS